MTSDPGWYPDPADPESSLRRWDGSAWTEETRPADGAVPAAPRGRHGGLLALLAVLVVLALVVLAATRPSREGAQESTDSSSPSISAWDETSTPTPTPTPTPSDEPTPSGSSVPCPADGTAGGEATGGELRSAGLVVTMPPGFTQSSIYWGRFIHDHVGATKDTTGSWVDMMSLGRLSRQVFTSPKFAAQAVVACHTTSGNFSGRTVGTVESSTALTVGGKPAWRHRARVGSTSAPGGGAVYDVTVVDLGDPEWLSVYWLGVVLADTDTLGRIDETWRSLHLS